MLEIKKFIVNPLQENTFLVYDETKNCVIIDAGFYYGEEEDEIDEFIKSNELNVQKLLNTHGHFDHVMGVEYLRNKYKVDFYIHKDDEFLIERAVDQAARFGFEIQRIQAPDHYLEDRHSVVFGNSELKIIQVPGHSPGHVVFYAERDKKLIAGDVLFYGSIGRTDLPGGDYQTLINGIKSKLFLLPDETEVFCGHGPETSIGLEKRQNPFLT